MRVLDLYERVRVRATQQRGNRFRRAIPRRDIVAILPDLGKKVPAGNESAIWQ